MNKIGFVSIKKITIKCFEQGIMKLSIDKNRTI